MTPPSKKTQPDTPPDVEKKPQPIAVPKQEEIGGPKGPEPTRYGDWQHKGRVSDF